MKVCVVVFSIGEEFTKSFNETFYPSIVKYTAKYGYDLKVFHDFLDAKHRHLDCVSFQKCLVASTLPEYDLIMVIDADIWLTELAPPIHTIDFEGKIGVVDEVSQVSNEDYLVGLKGFATPPSDYYSLAGFSLNTNVILNGGVLMCQPALHADFLRNLYWKYIENAIGHPRGLHYEQSCFGYEIQSHNMFKLLPREWDIIHPFFSILKREIPVGTFALHFCAYNNANRKKALQAYLAAQAPKSLIRWGIRK